MSNSSPEYQKPTSDDTIGSRFTTRQNNLDLIRLFAASLVIISHAFPLSVGKGAVEPLRYVTHQIGFGRLGVLIFFIISGFLITASYEHSKNVFLFMRARVFRIIPGLILATAFVAFVLGPLVTSLPTSSYFSDKSVYVHFIKTICLRNSGRLPGVFTSNPFQGAVNGSLWTLRYEVLCYCLVAVLGVTKLLRKWIVVALFIGAMSATIILSRTPGLAKSSLGWAVTFSCPFLVGMLLYLYRYSVKLNWSLFSAAALIVVASAHFGGLDKVVMTLGGYIVMFCAFTRTPAFANIGKYGDFSYGMYIYAFPIQQTIVLIMGGRMAPWLNMLIALPCTLIFAMISWHLVEKRFIRRRKKLAGAPN